MGEQGRNIYPGEHREQGTGTDQYGNLRIPQDQYELSGYAWNGGGNFVWGGIRSSSNVYNTAQASLFGNEHIYTVLYPVSGGGGATDISLDFGTYAGGNNMYLGGRSSRSVVVDSLAWKSPEHLYSRIIVAGGGGGALYYASGNDGNGFADGGDGGAWKGGNGLFNDYGYGGELDRGGLSGGNSSSWYNQAKASNSYARGSALSHSTAKIYDDGPWAGGYSGYDGMFGEGGGYTMGQQGDGCGGGGWYGGGAGSEAGANGSGAGGSSFMWTDKVIVDGIALAAYYTKTSDFKNNAIVNYTANGFWGDPDYYNAPSLKYPDIVPTTAKISYFTEVVTADSGVRAGDGKAMITAVEIDDICVNK